MFPFFRAHAIMRVDGFPFRLPPVLEPGGFLLPVPRKPRNFAAFAIPPTPIQHERRNNARFDPARRRMHQLPQFHRLFPPFRNSSRVSHSGGIVLRRSHAITARSVTISGASMCSMSRMYFRAVAALH